MTATVAYLLSWREEFAQTWSFLIKMLTNCEFCHQKFNISQELLEHFQENDKSCGLMFVLKEDGLLKIPETATQSSSNPQEKAAIAVTDEEKEIDELAPSESEQLDEQPFSDSDIDQLEQDITPVSTFDSGPVVELSAQNDSDEDTVSIPSDSEDTGRTTPLSAQSVEENVIVISDTEYDTSKEQAPKTVNSLSQQKPLTNQINSAPLTAALQQTHLKATAYILNQNSSCSQISPADIIPPYQPGSAYNALFNQPGPSAQIPTHRPGPSAQIPTHRPGPSAQIPTHRPQGRRVSAPIYQPPPPTGFDGESPLGRAHATIRVYEYHMRLSKLHYDKANELLATSSTQYYNPQSYNPQSYNPAYPALLPNAFTTFQNDAPGSQPHRPSNIRPGKKIKYHHYPPAPISEPNIAPQHHQGSAIPLSSVTKPRPSISRSSITGVKKSASAPVSQAPAPSFWTEEETNVLKWSWKKHRNERNIWELVSKDVQTKTVEQCKRKFRTVQTQLLTLVE